LTRRALRQAAILGLPLKEMTDVDGSRSELEGHFLRLCRRHRLPAPEVNVRIGPFLVDFLWRERRLIVEVDGYRYHRGRLAFEADRSRDVELKLAGYDVVRLTYRQVVHHRERTARRLATLLTRAQEGRSPS
jgi:very-short-patch-repair endonuclease